MSPTFSTSSSFPPSTRTPAGTFPTIVCATFPSHLASPTSVPFTFTLTWWSGLARNRSLLQVHGEPPGLRRHQVRHREGIRLGAGRHDVVPQPDRGSVEEGRLVELVLLEEVAPRVDPHREAGRRSVAHRHREAPGGSGQLVGHRPVGVQGGAFGEEEEGGPRTEHVAQWLGVEGHRLALAAQLLGWWAGPVASSRRRPRRTPRRGREPRPRAGRQDRCGGGRREKPPCARRPLQAQSLPAPDRGRRRAP